MNTEHFTNYWIGQEPTGPGHSPTLNQMPAYVDVAPLAFVGITDDDQLDFTFLTQQNSAATIQGWIKTVRAQGTKVLLSINSQQFASIQDPSGFAQTVQSAITECGVDGIDIDFEPPFQGQTLITVVKQLRATLGSGVILTAPVYSAWLACWTSSGSLPIPSITLQQWITRDIRGSTRPSRTSINMPRPLVARKGCPSA
jgi:hypothetical protein